MKNNTLIAVAFLIILILLGVYHFKTIPKIGETDTIFSTDTFRYTDTIYATKVKPIPKYIETVKTDTFYTNEGKDTVLTTENKIYSDTLCAQKDTAIITSFISGIKANQDSIKLELRKTNEVITNTIEITKYVKDKKHFHISPQIGIGYGITHKNIDGYVGIGIGYEF